MLSEFMRMCTKNELQKIIEKKRNSTSEANFLIGSHDLCN